MFRLSQKADYGLMLLSSFVRQGKISKDKPSQYVSIASVAREKQIPTKFLSQIALELKKAGILTSREGVSGGYLLAKDPHKIRLLDVLKILEGELVEGKCFEEGHECSCGAGEMWQEMKKQMEATIGKKTVADLVLR